MPHIKSRAITSTPHRKVKISTPHVTVLQYDCQPWLIASQPCYDCRSWLIVVTNPVLNGPITLF